MACTVALVRSSSMCGHARPSRQGPGKPLPGTTFALSSCRHEQLIHSISTQGSIYSLNRYPVVPLPPRPLLQLMIMMIMMPLLMLPMKIMLCVNRVQHWLAVVRVMMAPNHSVMLRGRRVGLCQLPSLMRSSGLL